LESSEVGMERPYDLDRFLKAQSSSYETALAEIRAGQKTSHWMWYIFPQLEGLGQSQTAQHFGISGFMEAVAYLDHEILGPRLIECTQAATRSNAPSLEALLGPPDDKKFRSSMTLFCVACADVDSIFKAALNRWHLRPDQRTLDILTSALHRQRTNGVRAFH
jgi:uncharacterized protein (DUF1810 family)